MLGQKRPVALEEMKALPWFVVGFVTVRPLLSRHQASSCKRGVTLLITTCRELIETISLHCFVSLKNGCFCRCFLLFHLFCLSQTGEGLQWVPQSESESHHVARSPRGPLHCSRDSPKHSHDLTLLWHFCHSSSCKPSLAEGLRRTSDEFMMWWNVPNGWNTNDI